MNLPKSGPASRARGSVWCRSFWLKRQGAELGDSCFGFGVACRVSTRIPLMLSLSQAEHKVKCGRYLKLLGAGFILFWISGLGLESGMNWLVKTNGTILGDWDVHWGYRILTHDQLIPHNVLPDFNDMKYLRFGCWHLA